MKTDIQQPPGGYILVSVIWILAFLSIAAASIGEWYDRSLAVAAGRVNDAEARVERLSTRATLLYEIATADLGRSGIFLSPALVDEEDSDDGMFGLAVRPGVPDIFFDGAVYRGYGDLRFSIQDESGLWGLIPESPMRVRQLLMSRGIEFQEADVLASRLADYTDEDDLVRINGAEAVDYEFAGLEPPPNRRPTSIHELKRVMGWADVDELWDDNALPNLVSLAWGGGPNPGTAPREVLLRMPGATPPLVDAFLAARRGDTEALDADTAAWVEELTRREVLSPTPRPSFRLRMRFWREGERQLREYSVKFNPGDQLPYPWEFENNYRLPVSRDLASEPARPAQLPDFVL
jgi:general secretion pathway protein K